MILIDVGYRRYVVRALQLGGLVLAVVFASLAELAFLEMKVEGTDRLAPRWQRIAMGSGIVMMAAAIVAAIFFYGTKYVVRLERKGDLVEIVSLGVYGLQRRRVPVRDVRVSSRYAGRVPGKPYQATPYRLLRLPGVRIPLVLDMQGRVVDEAALAALGRGAG